MCGDCKYFQPDMKGYLLGLGAYGTCRCPHDPSKGERRSDYATMCRYGERA